MDASAINTGVNSALGQDQFLELLVTQLRNQDPLNPITNEDFIAQLAQFSTLQGITDLNTSFGSLLKLQQLTQGASILGRTATFTDSSGLLQTAQITALNLSDGNIQFLSGDQTIPIDNVQQVT
jgi:flagellar basal-body rod modification protein FlgD